MTRQGASSRRSRRKARIRSVILSTHRPCAIPAREIARWTHSSKATPSEESLGQRSLAVLVASPRAVETRGLVEPRNRAGDVSNPKGRRQSGWCAVTTTDAGPRTEVLEPFRVAYVTDGEDSSARPARRTSLFGNPTFGGPAGDQKSPLRRCFKPRPLVENECKPVASDRRSWCGAFDPGGCPASCPDAHRPARSHRHVRIRRENTYAIGAEDTRCEFACPRNSARF